MPQPGDAPLPARETLLMVNAAIELARIALMQALQGQPERAAALADELDRAAIPAAARNRHQAALFRSVAAALRADIG